MVPGPPFLKAGEGSQAPPGNFSGVTGDEVQAVSLYYFNFFFSKSAEGITFSVISICFK